MTSSDFDRANTSSVANADSWETLQKLVQDFCDQRDWRQFHTPKELATTIVTEAAELLQEMRFRTDAQVAEALLDPVQRQALAEELGDITMGLLRFAEVTEMNLRECLINKLKLLDLKYPPMKSRGSNQKMPDGKTFGSHRRVLLSVNVNKWATLRNARGGTRPDLIESVQMLVRLGVMGITVHPRPDERHIRRQDVLDISSYLKQNAPHVEFNIEGYPDARYLELIRQVEPNQATLVPDPPNALTSNQGWRVRDAETFLFDVVSQLRMRTPAVSLFIDPAQFSDDDREALLKIAPQRIELYTEAYAKAFRSGEAQAIMPKYQNVARWCYAHGIRVNAGHDLDLANLRLLCEQVPQIGEVSIGHALICEAIEMGLPQTIRCYQQLLVGLSTPKDLTKF